jgi:hypothetical protein
MCASFEDTTVCRSHITEEKTTEVPYVPLDGGAPIVSAITVARHHDLESGGKWEEKMKEWGRDTTRV